MIDIVLTAMWLMLPAYIPNSNAVVFAGGKPIDGGRNLGDGKTTEGFWQEPYAECFLACFRHIT